MGFSQKPQVMVVDDDLAMCGYLRTCLETRGFDTITVSSADDAIQRFQQERPMAVLVDIVLPGPMDGLALLTALRALDRHTPVIVISGQGRTSTVVQAMKLGATDFVCKPVDDMVLDVLLGNALRQRQLAQEVATLREQLSAQSKHTMLYGASEAMHEVRTLIEHVADTDVTVLIRGESGTGKELVARALHERSLRRDKPFVKVNCAALPAELLESELFGFEKGAFTGAIQHKAGKFEFANHGTIFLDEIAEMGVPLQAKLLQVVQDGEFSRLGSKTDVQVDVRVIAATNRNLEAAVAEGQFREDLYFRLNVVTIDLPPLRERRDEIPLLVDHFLKKYSVQYNRPLTAVSADLQQQFMRYDWPGNIRQLENLIKRMIVLGTEAPIVKELQQPAASSGLRAAPQAVTPPAAAPARPDAAPLPVAAAGGPLADGEVAVAAGAVSLKEIARTAAREAERELIQRMLTRTCWNRKEAAENLGISYKALLYKIKENGLDRVS